MKNKNLYVLVVLMLMGALFLSACGGSTEEPAEETTQEVEESAEEAEEPAEEAAEEPVEEEAMEEEAEEEPMEEPTEEPMEEEAEEEPMEEPTEEPMEEPTEEPAEEAAAEEPELAITIWADDTRAPILQDLAEGFAAEYGVALIVEEIGFGDIRDQMSIAAPAGEGPDIIVGAHDWLGELVSNGLLAPMDLGPQADNFVPATLDAFSYNGELYGMPNAFENVAFFINTDIVPECPATWDEVFTISEELSADNDDNTETNAYGFVRMEGDPFHYFPIQTAFGGYVFGVNESGYDATDVGIDSEGSLAAAEWYDSYVKAGLQPPAVDWDTMHLMFESGQSAMTITGPWALDRIREAGVPYAICDLPDATAEGVPFGGVQGFMVSAFSDDPLLAQIFLTEFVATEEVMQAFYDANPRPSAFAPVLDATDDPDLAAFGSAGANSLPMPAIPEMASVWESWGNAVILISQQGDDPVNAFTNAADQIRTAIEEGQ